MRRLALFIVLFLSIAPSVSAATTPPEPLKWEMLSHFIAYFPISKFTPEMGPRIRATMQQIADRKPRGVILDLRKNQGGNFDAINALLSTVLPKGYPYMRNYSAGFKLVQTTNEPPLLKKSTPIVLMRDQWTGNEADIVLYVLQKLRKGDGVLEFNPHRQALQRVYKRHAEMNQYRPIKEATFFVTPDVRMIGDEGADQDDMIPRAISMVRELSPWDEPKKAVVK